MNDSQIPAKFAAIFANAAPAGNVTSPFPVTAQSGGLASLNTGFTTVNFTPIAGGGVPPWGKDFNGLLQLLTAWDQWFQAGGPIPYDGAFQTAIGGYPKNAIVASAVTSGLWWRSTVENNATNPDTGGAGWVTWPITYPLTAHAVVVGEGTNPLAAVGPGAQGVPLLGNGASSDPQFAALNLSGGAAVVTGDLPIANGGTNATSFVSGGVVFYDGTRLTQNAPLLFWSVGSGFLGVGTNAPTATLHVAGTALVTGTFTANSTATFGSSLSVAGAAAFSSTLSVGASVTFNSSLSVAGAAVFSSTISVASSATLNGSLTVAGAASLNSTLNVAGAAALNSTLSVTGATTLSQSLLVGNGATITGVVGSGYGLEVLSGGIFATGNVNYVGTTTGFGLGAIGPSPVVEWQNGVGGNTWVVQHNNAASLTFSFNTLGKATLDQFGNLNIQGTLTQASDRALKDRIELLDPVTDVIAALRPVRCVYRDEPDRERWSLVAQEIPAGLAHAVRPMEQWRVVRGEEPERQEDVLGVTYNDIVVALVREVQDLRRELDALRKIAA
jgi:hypothetical protein